MSPAWASPLVRRISTACGARHPDHPNLRCGRTPHTAGEVHWVLADDGAWLEWPATQDSPAGVETVPGGEYL